MTKGTYIFEIDWDNDGDFGDANEDITSDVYSASWGLGFAKPHDPIAKTGELALELVNTDRKYSPAYTGGPLYGNLKPMRKVRVRGAVPGGSTVVLWTGYIRSIDPGTGKHDAIAKIVCQDAMGVLASANASIELQANKRADELIPTVLAQHDGIPRDLETGQSTFPYAGDKWRAESTKITTALRDIASSELGQIWVTRGGTLRFIDRNWKQKATAYAGTIDDSMSRITVEYGLQQIYNVARCTVEPREIESGTFVLWTNQGTAVEVQANSRKTVRAQFRDDNGNRVGAGSVITPEATTDYRAFPTPEGTGWEYTTEPRLTVEMEPKAESAEITFQWGSVEGYGGTPVLGPIYMTHLQVRGVDRLVTYDRQDFAAIGTASTAAYNVRELVHRAPLLDETALAEAFAEYFVFLYEEPQVIVKSAEIVNGDSARLDHIMYRTIGDRLVVSDYKSGLTNEDYFIIGEKHQLSDGFSLHRCTWQLERADTFKAWLLGITGRSELGQATYVGV